MIGVINHLDPSWMSEGDDEAEALTVEILVEGFLPDMWIRTTRE